MLFRAFRPWDRTSLDIVRLFRSLCILSTMLIDGVILMLASGMATTDNNADGSASMEAFQVDPPRVTGRIVASGCDVTSGTPERPVRYSVNQFRAVLHKNSVGDNHARAYRRPHSTAKRCRHVCKLCPSNDFVGTMRESVHG